VVVLGAGATRGAEFVEKHNPICLPPLNLDFFTQLQRISAKKHQETIDAVLKDVRRLYGTNYKVSLEQYVTQIESLLAITNLVPGSSSAYTEPQLLAMRARLLNGLSAVLEESADVSKRSSVATLHPCGYHQSVVESLKARDTVISFNYDCVMDDSLRRHATGRWSAQYGYCFTNPLRVKGHEVWSAAESPQELNSSVNLLKLHGSLNWRPLPPDSSTEIKLREKPYKQNGDKDFELVPPENVKRLDDRVLLKDLWGKAERAIRHAKTVCLVGFSFTPTDLHVDSLFRVALAANRRLELVVIVNPSADHRRSIRAVFSTQLNRDIRLVQFDRFGQFAPHAKQVLDPR
jgi:hypothetical protein